MLVLNVKLARHGECSSLVANETLRGYNIAKLKLPDTGMIVCKEEDFDLTKSEFTFPIMVSREKAIEKYSLT
jgi:hypothetical protein